MTSENKLFYFPFYYNPLMADIKHFFMEKFGNLQRNFPFFLLCVDSVPKFVYNVG